MSKFSVLMSVHQKENPEFLRAALDSVLQQTLPPDEVVLVEDGPLLPEHKSVINSAAAKGPIKSVVIPQNIGLGAALAKGLESCQYDIVARMDSDDICELDRFETQIQYLDAHPDIDIIGSWIAEFDNDPGVVTGVRELPTDSISLRRFARRRNPLNHQTVMFRKAAVFKAGNYADLRCSQDYHLWVRMLANGARFANIPRPLVRVRGGRSMISRRGGWRYVYYDFVLQREFLRLGFISPTEFTRNMLLRASVRLLPRGIRSSFYGRFLRTS